MLTGLKVWPESSQKAQIDAFVNFITHAYTDTSANLINCWSYNQKANTSTMYANLVAAVVSRLASLLTFMQRQCDAVHRTDCQSSDIRPNKCYPGYDS